MNKRWSTCLGTLALLAQAAAEPAANPIAIAAWQVDPDDQGFAIQHAATAMGLPLVRTADLDAALAQPMLVLAGQVTGARLTEGVEGKLDAYVRAGGTLVLDDLETRVARNLAGLGPIKANRSRYRLAFDEAADDPGLKLLKAPEARTIPLGNPTRKEAIATQGLEPLEGQDVKVLARFEDGANALTVRTLDKGHVYALGAKLADLVLRPQINRDFEAQRWYDNHFEPGADVPQILLRGWYLAHVPGAVALDPAPEGREGSLILTHDVDFRRSVGNMAAYLKAEQAKGVRSTFFVQTKVVKDYQDTAFYDATAKQVMEDTLAGGAEIQSHTVAHAYDWSRFPRGTGKEAAGTYLPKVLSRGDTDQTGKSQGGSVAGEIRVSKQLLLGAGPKVKAAGVDAFRAGYLAINPLQFEVLAEEGYKYDSSYSANDLLTAFPFRAMVKVETTKEAGITEFPVLLADSVSPLLKQVPAWKAVLDKESAFHAPCVVLIHPDVVADKLPTELALIDHVKNRFWIGGLRAFGRFWDARAGAGLSASGLEDNTQRVMVEKPVDGLTLNFPHDVTVKAVEGAKAEAKGASVVLGEVKGPVKLDVSY